MDVFQAAKIAKQYVKENAPRHAVQFTRVVAVSEEGEVLTFESARQANEATTSAEVRAWIFDCIYRDGKIEVKPAS